MSSLRLSPSHRGERFLRCSLATAALLLAACGTPNPSPDAGATFTVGGTATGLVLQNNAGDDLTVATAIKTDGSLWAWGRNEFVTVGAGTATHRYNPM